ncbi:MAG: EAL domain-containing protein [Halioglobus sp.]|nr:EAL domain-containing protein [Halioglobus sp.]
MTPFFLARQPIFHQNLRLFAYELLFRSSTDNQAPDTFDENMATAEVITASAEIGFEKLTRGHPGFINLPQQFLTDPDLMPLPADNVVLEILETFTLNNASKQGINTLHARGFRLALDDFIDDPALDEILHLIDIVKLDVRALPQAAWEPLIARLRRHDCQILAEKVETHDEFELLKALGVDYYQGYFFARPKLIRGHRISSNKVALLHMLAKINDPATDVEELQQLVSCDVALSIKALTFVNSAAQGLNRRIESIREAIVYLGRETIKRWVTLYLMASVDEKPNELLTLALVRAKLCELIAQKQGRTDVDTYFTVGLFSILDSLLDLDIASILKQLHVTPEMRAALLHSEGTRGEVLTCAREVEAGHLGKLPCAGLDALEVATLHTQAINWADDSLREMGIRN